MWSRVPAGAMLARASGASPGAMSSFQTLEDHFHDLEDFADVVAHPEAEQIAFKEALPFWSFSLALFVLLASLRQFVLDTLMREITASGCI